jgi:hypothetical protein
MPNCNLRQSLDAKCPVILEQQRGTTTYYYYFSINRREIAWFSSIEERKSFTRGNFSLRYTSIPWRALIM